MSDALCGPSNPLQQFKQQTSLDRTLQQDRLASRHNASQGFRSHDPHAGLLDPDFEAFQAGVPLPELPQFQQRQPAHFAGPSSSQTPSWAADFQRMQISPSPMFPQQQQWKSAVATGESQWTQGFRESMVQNAPRAQTSSHSPQAFQHMARYGGSAFQPTYSPSTFASSGLQSKGKEPVMDEQFDDAAFERAFDQARLDLMAVDDTAEVAQSMAAVDIGATTENQDFGEYDTHVDVTVPDAMHDSSVQQQLSQNHDAQALEDANLRIPEDFDFDSFLRESTTQQPMPTEQRETPQTADDDDALAATARELLEKVENNTTDKFKNSQFLTLMRKLRDREMKVEGDQMVETPASNATTTTTTAAVPASSTSTTATREEHSPEFLEQLRESASKKRLLMSRYSEGFDNSEQTPYPLGHGAINLMHADIRQPFDYPERQSIPAQEQDHDPGRLIDPNDGADVVDYLAQNGRGRERRTSAAADDIDSEFMMTTPYLSSPSLPAASDLQ